MCRRGEAKDIAELGVIDRKVFGFPLKVVIVE
jgi:hypothetical protein